MQKNICLKFQMTLWASTLFWGPRSNYSICSKTGCSSLSHC